MFKKFVPLFLALALVLAASTPAFSMPSMERLQERFGVEDEEGSLPGPPAFVREMLQLKFQVMAQEKIKVRDRPFQSDLPPVIKEGRTLIPVRAVVNGLGADVAWDELLKTVTITRGDVVIVLYLDTKEYYVNGQPFMLDVPAQLLSNRTFVPLRFIAEALGEKVHYDANTMQITIGTLDD